MMKSGKCTLRVALSYPKLQVHKHVRKYVCWRPARVHTNSRGAVSGIGFSGAPAGATVVELVEELLFIHIGQAKYAGS
eukprot:1190010-Prorocentrum_minimum.AAC.5